MYSRSKSVSKKALISFTAAVLAPVVAFSGFAALNVSTANAEAYTVDKTHEEYVAASTALNIQIMEEGMVLLKNKDNALPLSTSDQIGLLGAGSYYTLWGETGGGNGKTDYTYIADSLAHAGFSNVKTYDYSGAKQVTFAGAKVYLDPEVSTLNITSGDTAIITLSRSGKESYDNYTVGASELTANGWEEGTHQLQLNTNEKALIESAKQNFSKVVILLNAPTTMQIPELEADDGVDAIMFIGMPGQYGLEAVGNVLSGAVSPSGRTVTTWAADFTKDPTYANVTTQTGTISDDQGNDVATLEYEEGIYVGYKYYETAAAEEYIDYDKAVVYPFGYGLSYTSFTQEFVGDSFAIPEGATFDTYIDVDVKVTNTGSVAGKEVVQIYGHAPYTAGEIEKSEVVLVGFGKTQTLAPGASANVTVQVRVGDLASFDWNDANSDNWYGYEIESGDYELRLQKNSHEVIDTIAFGVEQSLAFNNDGSVAAIGATEDKSNLVFSTGDDFDSLYLATEANGGDFTIMSRADFAGTFPTSPTGTNKYSATVSTKYNSEYTPDMDTPDDYWYVESVPEGWTQGTGTNYMLYDMVGIDYTSTEVITDGIWAGKTGVEAWEIFMNQLTWDEVIGIPAKGSHMTVAVPSIGKPQQADSDGPEQLGNGTFWACANIIAATWNAELCYERGVAIGNESLFDGYPGWYGPTANINRSPFGGRNNIYYSEDALLTGKISAANIAGARSRGVISYVKHFAINEQETNRSGLATFVTEQALRETYLKAFEYTIKEGGSLGIMQSMNRVGAVNCYGNYALDKVVLRDEWGFLGALITDSYSSGLVRENMAQRMGGDFPLGTFPTDFAGTWDAASNMVKYNGVASPTQWYVIRNSAMHVLYMAVNSNQMMNGYNLTELIGKSVSAGLDAKGKAIPISIGLKTEIEPINAGIDLTKFGTTNVTYTATGLPTGLTIDSKTGVISGTPTEEGDFTATVTLSVNEAGEEWITSTYSAYFTVEKTAGGAGLSTGAIIGIVAGVVVVLAAAGVVTAIVLKKKKSTTAEDKEN